MSTPSRTSKMETRLPPAVYEYGVRHRDGRTEAGFHTEAQAQLFADSHHLKNDSYSIERRPVGYWGQESLVEQLRLYTTDEVAAMMGHISPATIRRLARRGQVEWVKGARGKVLMTEAQIGTLVKHLTQPTGEGVPT